MFGKIGYETYLTYPSIFLKPLSNKSIWLTVQTSITVMTHLIGPLMPMTIFPLTRPTPSSNPLFKSTQTFSGFWTSAHSQKLNIFLWQCLHDFLPKKLYLSHIGIAVEATCKIRKQEEESSSHIFLQCPIDLTFGILLAYIPLFLTLPLPTSLLYE